MLPPFYYKNESEDGYIAYFSEVIDKIGNQKLKIYLFHFPQMSGVSITLKIVQKVVKSYPGVFIGMKDSSGDVDSMVNIQKCFPEFPVKTGLLPLLKEGGAGFITACTNVLISLKKVLYKEWFKNVEYREAVNLNFNLCSLCDLIYQMGLSPALKSLISRFRGKPDSLKYRPPLTPLKLRTEQLLFNQFDKAKINIT